MLPKHSYWVKGYMPLNLGTDMPDLGPESSLLLRYTVGGSRCGPRWLRPVTHTGLLAWPHPAPAIIAGIWGMNQ